ncbi:tubulointerstitial nephritis antigen-like [Branchiostoma floridae x Branchiostoma belcheri]
MRTMTWPGLCVVLLVTFVHVESQQQPNLVFREPPRAVTGTSYCSLLNCCRGRSDSCSLPYFDTICYCDEFCNRTSASDCCPDYRPVCLGLPPPNEPTPLPQPPETDGCFHDGTYHPGGATVRINCNQCVCQPTQAGSYEFRCQENPCLLRPTMLEAINQGDYGWQAEAYPFLYGLTLDQGLQYKLGTDPVPESVHAMRGIQVSIRDNIPEFFDARSRWPGLIQDVRDQGNCGASWAFSTTAVLADRLAIQSRGTMTATLSPQNLLSCNTNRQRGCQGGRLDRAWWFLRKKGVTTDACYPYSSGSSAQAGQCAVPRSNGRPYPCPSNNGDTTMKYQSSPAYKISNREEDIMKEIMTNGPVQATMEVKPDLFSYRSGVYRHTELAQGEPPEYRRRGWHSVRIVGWGVEMSNPYQAPIKYWTVANSWGKQWGEEGYFRIVRGENECQIESFVLGVWGKVNPMVINNRVQRRRRRRSLK